LGVGEPLAFLVVFGELDFLGVAEADFDAGGLTTGTSSTRGVTPAVAVAVTVTVAAPVAVAVTVELAVAVAVAVTVTVAPAVGTTGGTLTPTVVS
jgi:hypothetical protein